MQSLIVSPLIFYTLLVLDSFTAGYLLVRSLTFSEKSKLIKYILFSLGLLFAIAVGGAFKAPGFIMFTGNAEKARFSNNTGDFSLANGNLVFSTSGTGIDFGATSDATGKTSELFDDYEEGTWTPSLNKVGATGNADGSVGSRAGYYIKCGSMLWVSFYWYSANLSFGTGTYAWYIANLPYNLLHNINKII